MNTAFAPWQQRVYYQALDALKAGRLGHALLLCGPVGLGKRAIANRLARYVLSGGEPDSDNRDTHLIDAGTHPDLQQVSFIPTRDGSKLRTEIVIEQIRELSQKLSLTPQYGRAQIAMIDPADAVNNAAWNALLKTLEEPQPDRYLWLLCASPMRLPATIRSRCQRLEMHLPPHAEALAWLIKQGFPEASSAEALDAAHGHPGLALAWMNGNGMALRREVSSDLLKLARGQLPVVETAQRWANDEHTQLRLQFASDLVLAQAADLALTNPVRVDKLAEWFEAANRTRDLLHTTVRADLAIVDLLLAWRDGVRATVIGEKV